MPYSEQVTERMKMLHESRKQIKQVLNYCDMLYTVKFYKCLCIENFVTANSEFI